MPVSDEFMDYARDLLGELGPLRLKRMFGGVGVYSGEDFFGILVDDEIYLKADDRNRDDYLRRGLKPFSYRRKDGRVTSMGYYPLPPDILEDPETLALWAGKAREAARRGKRARRR